MHTDNVNAISTDDKPVILIPAYCPDDKLIGLLTRLRGVCDNPIVVVDDGGGKLYESVFVQAACFKDCHILTHEQNKGKGAALKTGITFISRAFPNTVGCVTADADGQHSESDILALCEALYKHPGALILGVRDFSADDVPARSRMGNRITALVFRMATGVRCSDTQTGLRGISAGEFKNALDIEGDRYEYEMYQLLECARRGVEFIQLAIKTIYIDENSSSHFHVFRDSMLIYGCIIRFAASSIVTTLIDLTAFTLLSRYLLGADYHGVFLSTVIARICSGAVNFALNSKWVFGAEKTARAFFKYVLVFLLIMALSASIVGLLSQLVKLPVLVKIIVDGALFFLSYYLQKRFVFSAKDRIQ